jgi:hypothetical protein
MNLVCSWKLSLDELEKELDELENDELDDSELELEELELKELDDSELELKELELLEKEELELLKELEQELSDELELDSLPPHSKNSILVIRPVGASMSLIRVISSLYCQSISTGGLVPPGLAGI